VINFRNIFNSYYGYIGYSIIFLLFLILIIVNKSIRDSFRVIGRILIWVGIIDFIILFLFKLSIYLLLDYQYRLFVNIIGDTLCSSLFYKSIICLLIGGILYFTYYRVRKI
jgi:hypothetical protein